MKVIACAGRDDLATVYLAEMGDGKVVEFVESLQPPLTREEKWVTILSTLYGCPVKCPICDAGSCYRGKLTKQDMLAQLDFLVKRRYPSGSIPARKFKVQFARMGEPAYNTAVLDVLKELPSRYDAPALMPCISTIAPTGVESFFESLLAIKQELYPGRFQLQFSIHSTDSAERDWLIPTKKWDFARIARYGERFQQSGDRKITLNFALVRDVSVDADELLKYFNPDIFLIKITPLNPTHRAVSSKLATYIDPARQGESYQVVEKLRSCGYQVIVSIGETEENQIGSNCGQYVTRHLSNQTELENAYQYPLRHYQQRETVL
ncbi:MAG: radical SAM protein [candidate division Zixibacteria bacterium]|nr:radical SAM protein [candidate division Zixibacteria bacterium]